LEEDDYLEQEDEVEGLTDNNVDIEEQMVGAEH
jgi:hypothetical protein